MDPNEARTALDDIRRKQGETREAYLRRTYAPKAVIGSALLLFAVYASFDLPGDHWPPLAAVASAVLLGGGWLACRNRVPVRGRPNAGEAAFMVLAGLGYIGAFVTLKVVATVLDLPVPNTVAAGGMALAVVASSPWLRRLHGAVLAAGPGAR